MASTPSTALLILLVEDEPDIRELFVEFLSQQGYRVASAIERGHVAALGPALLITNVRFPMATVGILDRLARAMDVPLLLISGHPQDPEPPT